jgi:hypothetical protein
VHTFEDFVAGFVSATASPPTFHNSLVVSINLKMNAGAAGLDDCENEQLESDALCPADVLSISFPPGNEFPSSPPSVNENANPVARASI